MSLERCTCRPLHTHKPALDEDYVSIYGVESTFAIPKEKKHTLADFWHWESQVKFAERMLKNSWQRFYSGKRIFGKKVEIVFGSDATCREDITHVMIYLQCWQRLFFCCWCKWGGFEWCLSLVNAKRSVSCEARQLGMACVSINMLFTYMWR